MSTSSVILAQQVVNLSCKVVTDNSSIFLSGLRLTMNASILGEPLNQEYGRWAVPRGDFLWLGYVDNWPDYYMSNGFLDNLYRELIGPTDGLPGS